MGTAFLAEAAKTPKEEVLRGGPARGSAARKLVADYLSMVRSNYFKAKDRKAFEEFCKCYDLEMFEGEGGCVGFCKDGVNEGISEFRYDPEAGGLTPVGFFKELSEHLDEEYVAVVEEIGHEKMRYFIGRAVASHPDGRVIVVDLDDIYAKVQKRWPDKRITDCSY